MALAQHHGLPTRLLGGPTPRSPHTATDGSPDTDGVVWAVDYEAAHERPPDHFQALLEELGTSMFNAAMLYDLMTLVIERTREDDNQLTDRRTLPMLDVRDVLEVLRPGRGLHRLHRLLPATVHRSAYRQSGSFLQYGQL